MNTVELREYDMQEMESVNGGSVLSDYAKGVLAPAGTPVTKVASLAAWQLGLIVFAVGCAIGICER